ncbi:MAG: LysR family transcriptional regulator [Peptococcaceae bacterium]
MRFEQLENVLEIARVGSINRAAVEMHLAQQSLMSSLNSLEDELGFQIFERSHKGVKPSASGAIFLEEARTVLQIYQGWNRFRDTPQQPQTVQVAMVSAFRQQISELCMEVFTRYEDTLKIQSEPCYLNNSLQDVLEKTHPSFIFYLDTNFCSFALSDSIHALLANDDTWCSDPLYQHSCEIFVPANHPWIQEGKTIVTYEDLQKQTLIFNSKHVVTLFPNCSKIVLPNKEGLLQAILTGKGVGVSLSTTVTDQWYLDSRQIIALPLYLDGKETQIQFKLLHRRAERLTTSEQKIMQIISEYYRKKRTANKKS